MKNEERKDLLVSAGDRLERASSDLTSTDKIPARSALRQAIQIVLAGTSAEVFTESLIDLHARNGRAFDYQAFNLFVSIVSTAGEDEKLSSLFIYCSLEEIKAF